METNAGKVRHWRERLAAAWNYRHNWVYCDRVYHRAWIRKCIQELRSAIEHAERNPDGTAITYPAIYI